MGSVQSDVNTFIIDNKEYVSLKSVGKGSFGSVYLVEDKNGSKFILKIIVNNNNSYNEIYIMKLLSYYPCNPYIICLYDYEITKDNIYILMEYNTGSDMKKFLKEYKNKSTDFDMFDKWFRQAIMGLCHIHKLGIIHRDIKPSNFLIDKDENLKYIDFGLSKLHKKNEHVSVYSGTKCYKEPFLKNGCYYTDIYALGITFVYMLNPTIDLCNIKSVYDTIDSVKFPLKYKFYKDLLHKMTRITPNRPSAREILNYLKSNGTKYLVIKDYKKCLPEDVKDVKDVKAKVKVKNKIK
jgi:serine/threonine protein kinase